MREAAAAVGAVGCFGCVLVVAAPAAGLDESSGGPSSANREAAAAVGADLESFFVASAWDCVGVGLAEGIGGASSEAKLPLAFDISAWVMFRAPDLEPQP